MSALVVCISSAVVSQSAAGLFNLDKIKTLGNSFSAPIKLFEDRRTILCKPIMFLKPGIDKSSAVYVGIRLWI